MAVDIAQLLAFAVKNDASGLHLSSGVPPMIRVEGDMKRINMPPLSHKEVHSMVYDIMNDKQRKAYEEFMMSYTMECTSLCDSGGILMRFMSPSTRIIGGTPEDRCRSEALFLTAKASSCAISTAIDTP